MKNLKEMKKTIPFNNSIAKLKYLLTNLAKEAKVLKTTKEAKNTDKLQNIAKIKTSHINGQALCSWTEKLNILCLSLLLKVTYRFNAISIKIPLTFFEEIEKSTLKFKWNLKGS